MTDYQHKEAFCLMLYGCEKCEHREWIWNSRDGVTPFGIACPSCGNNSLLHMSWHLDQCAPDYQLRPGQRFFRDGTRAEAEAIIRKRIRNYSEIPREVQNKLLKDARKGTGEWRPGWPMLDQAPLWIGEPE